MRVRNVMVVAVLAMGVGGIAATPAFASSGGNCSNGYFCLYENNDFNDGNTDHWRDFTANTSDFNKVLWRNANGSESDDHMDNEASSMQNKRGCKVQLFQNVGYTGASNTWVNGDVDGIFKGNAIGDNRASSVKMLC